MPRHSFWKLVALYTIKVLGGFRLARRVTRKKLRILCYHGFSVGDQHEFAPILFMRSETFRRRMCMLRRLKVRVVTLSHGLALLRSNAVRQGEVVITIDDGWKTTLTHGAPVLLEYSLPASVYITSYYAQRPVEVFNVAVRYLVWKTVLDEVTLDGLHPALDGALRLKGDAGEAITRWIASAERHLTWQRRQAVLELFCRSLRLDPKVVFAEDCFRLLNELEIARCRHFDLDVQLHTHRHTLPTDSLQALSREVVDNRGVLEKAKRANCTHLCYPSGIYTIMQSEWLRSVNVDSATTCDAGLNGHTTSQFLLKRHLDRDDDTDIEFEAEICGVTEIARTVRSALTGREEPKAEPTLA